MHSGAWDLEQAMAFCVSHAPHGELLDGSHHLWFELETTLRGVGKNQPKLLFQSSLPFSGGCVFAQGITC